VIDPAWLRFAAWIWLAGIASGAAAWTRDRRRIAGQLRGRVRATSGPAREILTELRRRSGARRDPDLYFAPGLASPISLGIRRPAICIPPQAETDLMRDELEALLAHELAHVERRDPLLLALCRAVEVVLFVQPLLRFARGRLVDEAEVLCDERAAGWTGDPAALASCLAEVATWVVAGRREELVPAMAARGSRLEGRVRGLLDGAASARAGESRRRPVLLPVAWALGLAPCALGVAPLAIGGIGLEAAGIEAPGIETAELGASGLEAEIVGAIPPPAEASPAALAASALELRELLELVENEYAALAADPRLASAPEATRARAAAIGTRIQTLHAASARLDALLAEDSSQER